MMKRWLSSLVALVFLLSLVSPLKSDAATYDKDLESAIVTAKKLFNITNEYDVFNSSFDDSGTNKQFYLNWSDSKGTLGNISVTIDEQGQVSQYYSYDPSNTGKLSLPKITKDKGLTLAKDFLAKVNKTMSGSTVYVEGINNYQQGRSFSYYLERIENGIRVPNNNVNISVDYITGAITNFNSSWNEITKFPAKDKIISQADAEKIFKEKLGIQLVYRIDYSKTPATPYLVYDIKDSNKVVDAVSGKVIQVGYVGMMRDMGGTAMAQKSAAQSISPQESIAVEGMKGMITGEEAEKAIRPLFKIPNTMKVTNKNVYKDWQGTDTYYWSLNFSNNKESYYVNIDAKTKELISFSHYVNRPEGGKATTSKEKAIATAKQYINQFHKNLSADVELTSDTMDNYNQQYNFVFTRKYQGIPVTDNNITVGIDGITGQLTNYNKNWSSLQFPSATGVKSLDEMYKKFFEQTNFGLEYSITYNDQTVQAEEVMNVESNVAVSSQVMSDDVASSEAMPEKDMSILPMPSNMDITVNLIYKNISTKPTMLDPVTGQLLDYNRKPYVEKKMSNYTDLEGVTSASIIQTLAQIGVSFDTTEFKPYEKITQQDFVYLLANVFSPGYSMYKETSYYQPYPNIIKKEENKPDALVTKLDAVKFILRGLNYDKVASIKGIYTLPYSDAVSIPEEYKGYVSIATGLGIVDGSQGNFGPTQTLTREEAAVMIYNLVKVE